MMVEETVWENHEDCYHSYDKRCHKSYTTTYTSVQVRNTAHCSIADNTCHCRRRSVTRCSARSAT